MAGPADHDECREFIVETAKTRPTKLGCPFTHWSIRKLADYLGSKKGRRVQLSRERLRQILVAEGITFQRTKTWKESPDPAKEQKLARIDWALEHARDRTFAFDEFGRSRSDRSAGSPPPTPKHPHCRRLRQGDVDLARADAVRNLDKFVWAVIICVSTPMGGMAYLSLGRVP